MLERGGQAVKQFKHSVTTTDHPLSRAGLIQARRMGIEVEGGGEAEKCGGGRRRGERQTVEAWEGGKGGRGWW